MLQRPPPIKVIVSVMLKAKSIHADRVGHYVHAHIQLERISLPRVKEPVDLSTRCIQHSGYIEPRNHFSQERKRRLRGWSEIRATARS